MNLSPPRLHIAVLGPIASEDVRPLLRTPGTALPRGYAGAPLMAVLITELLARGHRVSAITLSSDLPLLDQTSVSADGENFTMHWCPMRPRAWPPNRSPQGWRLGRIVDLYAFERRQLRHAIDAAAPDLVHAHWLYEFSAAAIASQRPHLLTSHDSPVRVARLQRGLRYAGYRWLRVWMARQVLRRARLVSAVSPLLAADLQAMARLPIEVVANPLAPAVWQQRRHAAPGRARVLMVGHGFNALKNSHLGMRAFALLAKTKPEAELVLIGDGFGPGEAAQAWWGARGGNLRFVGAWPHDAVLALMAECDVLLHPSLEESFGVVVAEALAIGLPVVAGRSSGAVPWVAGGAATLVDVNDEQALATALAACLTQPPALDAATRVEQGRAAMRERFTVARIVDGYEALYRRALSSPQH